MSAAITLPCRLDHAHAEGLSRSITARRGSDLVLRAGGVDQADLPGLHVLLSAVRTWKRDGRVLRLDRPSDAFEQQLGLFGLRPDALSTEPETRDGPAVA